MCATRATKALTLLVNSWFQRKYIYFLLGLSVQGEKAWGTGDIKQKANYKIFGTTKIWI